MATAISNNFSELQTNALSTESALVRNTTSEGLAVASGLPAASAPIHVQGVLCSNRVACVFRHHYLMSRRSPILSDATLFLCLLAGLFLIYVKDLPRLLAFGVVSTGCYCFVWRKREAVRLRRLEIEPSLPSVWQFSGEEIMTGNGNGHSQSLNWHRWRKVIQTPDGFLFYPDQSELFYWVPREGFSSEAEVSMLCNIVKQRVRSYQCVNG